MIVKENKYIFGIEYERTFSDSGFKIKRDGITYDEAIDPIGSDRTYEETDIQINDGEEADTEDYQESLKQMGVDFNV